MADIITRRYYIPTLPSGLEGWGIFFLDSIGTFTCVTDWGNYAYAWRAFGPADFREFLLGINDGYLLSKISVREEYQSDETLVNVKQHLIASRVAKDLTRETAREEWELLENCDDLRNEHDWWRWTSQTELNCLGDDGLVVYDRPQQAKAFVQLLWPRFKDMLRKELAEEKEAGSALTG